jgi:hypothetical protein
MRHGTKTIVITTPAAADAMLAHLEQCEQSARVDDYASERAKPIKWLDCTCCGGGLQGRDWWNQEPGYGLCDDCAPRCCGPIAAGEESSTYGVAGIHYLITKAERDNPPLCEDRGEPLYGIDERLRIEYDGFVYWKGRQIEHYDGSALHDTDQNKSGARELIQRCETIEARGEEVNTTSVIWRWEG